MRYSKVRTFINLILLIIIDQITKVIIDRHYLDLEFNLIKGVIAFKPYLNIDYSWINSLFKLEVGLMIHIIIGIVSLLIIIIIYDFLKYKKYNLLIIDFMFINLLAGAICSLIDKVFWGGSLDFIWLKGFFIFDIKDVYITIFEVTAVIIIIKKYKVINNFRIKEVYDYVTQKINSYRVQK